MAKKILLYGNESLLLRIRASVLEHSGFLVSSTLEHDSLSERFAAFQMNLLVLCHTLSSSERRAACSLANLLSPEAAVITLTSSYCVEADDGSELLNILDGPQALVDRVRQITA